MHLYVFNRINTHVCKQMHLTHLVKSAETKIYNKFKVPSHTALTNCKNLIFEIIGVILCLIVAYDRNKMFAPHP